jgi:hypothetical protein
MGNPVCKVSSNKFDLILLSPDQARRNILEEDFKQPSKDVQYSFVKHTGIMFGDDPDLSAEFGKLQSNFPAQGTPTQNLFLNVLSRGNVYVDCEATFKARPDKKNEELYCPRRSSRGGFEYNGYSLFVGKRNVEISIFEKDISRRFPDLALAKYPDAKWFNRGIPDDWAVAEIARASALVFADCSLPEHLGLMSASYGDYNNDGLTDLVLNLSNKGAIIFQQRSPW